jgi:hypothetical protein
LLAREKLDMPQAGFPEPNAELLSRIDKEKVHHVLSRLIGATPFLFSIGCSQHDVVADFGRACEQLAKASYSPFQLTVVSPSSWTETSPSRSEYFSDSSITIEESDELDEVPSGDDSVEAKGDFYIDDPKDDGESSCLTMEETVVLCDFSR